MPADLSALILELPLSAGVCDERAPDVANQDNSVGVCFSGGGSRALSCALGQLRGLRHLGLLDQVFAISSVSGGTWASSLFEYLPESIPDDDFLGGYLEEQFPVLNGLVPRYSYWPVRGRKTNPAQVYRYADGGSLENLGVNALLARDVPRLIVFVNTDEAVYQDSSSGDIGGALDAESFNDFPMYNTFTQLCLSKVLVNGLAHLSCWNVASGSQLGHPGQSNAQMVTSLFA